MRKILIKTAVLGMLTAAVMTMTAAAAVVGTGVVDADSLRVRSEPNTKCTTLSYLIGGTKVRVHEVLDGWYKISYGETTGYVSADYLDFTAADPAEQQEKAEEKKAEVEESKQGIVTGSCVNVRSGPSTGNSILAVWRNTQHNATAGISIGRKLFAQRADLINIHFSVSYLIITVLPSTVILSSQNNRTASGSNFHSACSIMRFCSTSGVSPGSTSTLF